MRRNLGNFFKLWVGLALDFFRKHRNFGLIFFDFEAYIMLRLCFTIQGTGLRVR